MRAPRPAFHTSFPAVRAAGSETAPEWSGVGHRPEGAYLEPKGTLMNNLLRTGAAVAGLAALAGVAYAGAASTEFDAAVDMMTDWLEGSLGLALALAFFATGLFMGIVRQSLMASAVAVACAFAVILGPGILAGVVTGSGATPDMAAELEGAAPQALPAALIAG